ncbi:MAG: phage late control D family protein, partial [Verrucomicrobiota bacterium]
MPPANRLLQVSRPSFEIDGQANDRLAEGLLRLKVIETIDGLYRCEATFGNWGNDGGRPAYLYIDRQVLDFGKAFTVKLDDTTLFEGRVMALEAEFPPDRPPEVTVLAEDRLQDLRMTRRTRTFTDQSDADVFRQIAGDHGVSPDIDLPGPTHKVLAQVNQSDLAFLRERARVLGAELKLEGTTFHVATRPSRGSEPIELNHGRQLRAFTVLADLAHQRTAMAATGWDVAAKSEIRQEAGDSVLGGELEDGESGASLLQSALGERKDSVVHTMPLTSDEARHIAESAFRLAARRFVRGRGVAEPAAHFRVGSTVDLVELGPLFSGKYYVYELCLRFDGQQGLRTEFSCERPW